MEKGDGVEEEKEILGLGSRTGKIWRWEKMWFLGIGERFFVVDT